MNSVASVETHPSYAKSIQEKLDIHDYLIDIHQLARKIKTSGKRYEGVYGVPRGGLIPAVYLSYILKLDQFVDLCDVTSNFLIVDDLVDTGETYSTVMESLEVASRLIGNGPDWAVLYTKPWCPVKPTYYIRETKNWIVFPYEDIKI